MQTSDLPVVKPEGRVLSTLESDGSRRWLHPKLSQGRLWRRRRVVAYALIALYALLPWIMINGRPALQFDLWHGRFSLFGMLLMPTDLQLLALFALLVVLTVFFATAIVGRVWCGWACPQTVYLEFVYRPIERLFMGTSGKGGEPKKQAPAWRVIAMYGVYLLISWHLANTFLAYFVGARNLNEWIWSSPPWEHPGAFFLVTFVTGLMMFDFCYWREQLCIIGCPYGRFQSVMLDRSSLIVGYDKNRGEPRGRGRDRTDKGDCVDCGMCVDVCPTGIDIRDGLQLECVNCTQCIDACNAVMDRVKRPRGLIRYSAQAALDGQATPITRPRVLIYSGLIVLLTVLFLVLLFSRNSFDVTLLRGMGSPFNVLQSGEVENIVRLKLVNRTEQSREYLVAPVSPPGLRLREPVSVSIMPSESATEPLHLVVPAEAFMEYGNPLEVQIKITDDQGAEQVSKYRLYGPTRAAKKDTGRAGNAD